MAAVAATVVVEGGASTSLRNRSGLSPSNLPDIHAGPTRCAWNVGGAAASRAPPSLLGSLSSSAAAAATHLRARDWNPSQPCKRERCPSLIRMMSPSSTELAPSSTEFRSGQETAAMEKVRLGSSDVEVPVIGIGAWSWGDRFFWNEGEWDDSKVKKVKQAFEASADAGVPFFDTAEVYGTMFLGSESSESLLGRFIAERKRAKRRSSHPEVTGIEEEEEKVIVATKFAPLPWRLGRASIMDGVKASLCRLGVDKIDLYQLHWPGVWQNEAYWDGLADVVEAGLVRAVGVSNYTVDRMRAAHAALAKRGVPLASNQVHYNLLYRVPESNGVKAACDDLGVSLIAYSPIAQGVLSGKYTPETPPSGPRKSIFSAEYLRKASPLLSRLSSLAEEYLKTPTQVALNWLLVQGNVIPIPGAKTADQAKEFVGAVGWRLTDQQQAELRTLAEDVPLYTGFPVERF